MYNNVYQEYINNILGSSPINTQSFGNNTYIGQMPNQNFQNMNNINMDLERFYPELYKLIYPMIKTACMKNTKPLTEENINEMVEEIYSNFISDDVTILNINLTNDVRSTSKVVDAKNDKKVTTTNRAVLKEALETKNRENSSERKFSPNNYVLSDLIKILVIRELAGKPGNSNAIRAEFLETARPFYGEAYDYSIYENPINMYDDFKPQYSVF